MFHSDSLSTEFRHESTMAKVKFKVALSSIQKYIRQGLSTEALLATMDACGILQKTQDDNPKVASSAKRMFSNICNRLVAIASEDIGPSEPLIPVATKSFLDIVKSPTATRLQKLRAVIVFVKALLMSRRCRCISDWKTAFMLPPYYLKEPEKTELMRLHNEVRETVGGMPPLFQRAKASFYASLETGDPDIVWETVSSELWKAGPKLNSVCLAMFRELQRYLKVSNSKYPPWCTDAVHALLSTFKAMTHKEKPIYLFHAIATVMYHDLVQPRILSVSKGFVDHVMDTVVGNLEKLAPQVRKNCLTHKASIMDLHTGTKSRSQFSDFARQSAIVKPQCDTLLNPVYRDMYVAMKVALDQRHLSGKEKVPSPKTVSMKREAPSPSIQESPMKKTAFPNKRQKSSPFVVSSRIPQVTKPISWWEDLKATMPLSQERTSRHKKHAIPVNDKVYKGTYHAEETGLRLALERPGLIDALQDAWDLGPQYRSTLWPSRLIQLEDIDAYVLEYPNVGTVASKETLHQLAQTRDTTMDGECGILPRSATVDRVSDVDTTPQGIPKDIQIASLYHLYAQWLLGCGDVGMFNILIRRDVDPIKQPRVIAGIDLEEYRGPIKKPEAYQNPMALLQKVASKKRDALYLPVIREVLQDMSCPFLMDLPSDFQPGQPSHVPGIEIRHRQFRDALQYFEFK